MARIISEISPNDKRGQTAFDRLLKRSGIKRDNNLEYIAGIYDENYQLIAGGAFFGNTLRCLAVDNAYQGEGLMAPIVSHLVEQQMARGVRHLFLYTKPENATIFSALGFHEVARVDCHALLMENLKNGFDRYLDKLRQLRTSGKTAALVMNCNPFTRGHRHLVERTASENDTVHLFVVSEDLSLFPFADRWRLIQEGTADLSNVHLHPTESYMISSAVFPSYFLQDEASAIETQAKLDLAIFGQIAAAAGVTRRYVGEEPFSVVTGLYNQTMHTSLPLRGIECTVVPRLEHNGMPISASRVRKLLQNGQIADTKDLVPESTYRYFSSESGQRVIERIQAEADVVHY
ncbi:MAG: [citrate (pro-3S)-lyase] ligase [Oscillospiraceae bacterium]|nr:[citrate (pro-3S)-lyase] ligase [Oscillospiraceae bacterium]